MSNKGRGAGSTCPSCDKPACLMPINGRVRDIDYCIGHLVAALNAANIPTVASCCGHGERPGIVMLEDGRELKVIPAPEDGEKR